MTYEHFADRDQLGDVVLERMLAGVSTRKYRRAQEPVGTEVETDARSTSKSAVSRTFVQRTRDQLWNLMNRPLADMRSGGDDARRDRAARPHEHRRARDHHRGRQARARPLGRLDRELDGRGRAARRLGRPRPRRRAGNAVRDRRIESPQESRPAGVRQRRARPALRAAQGTQRARSSPRARPSGGQGSPASRMGRDRSRPRARAAQHAGARARPRPPRRRRLTARGHGGDADGDPARDHRQAQAHAPVD